MRIAEAQLVRALGELEKEHQLTPRQIGASLQNFLRRKRLLRRSGKVLRALEAYEETRSGVVSVVATVAHPLKPQEETVIREAATKLFSKNSGQVATLIEVDPKLIGGVRLESRDTRYDFSLSRILSTLRKSL